ncbi:MAG: endonuclease III [Candidatus Aenigmarchaeota archaeon]|nr:endonuclease III [Candidatus Aenigmarchaeota archaeon]
MENAKKILGLLKKEYPDVKCYLHHGKPHELLFATILSAQCTDERVNKVTPVLFSRYKTLKDYASADLKELEKIIHPTGFYKQKAKYIRGSARILLEKHKGKIPDSMEQLTELPGVARKTANIVLANIHGKMEGIAVDTHVFRLSHRLGLSEGKTPDKTEQDLIKLFPRADWDNVNLLLIAHGRAVCTARSPRCPACILKNLCPSARVFHPELK